MPGYDCDLCDKSYPQKRNLKRHVREKHRDVEFYNCPERGCVTKFIRREYVSRHLCNIHGYAKLKANEAACFAPRGDIQDNGYYDNESEYDSVFDLIGEMNDENYNSKYMDTIENFDSNLLPEHLDYFDDVNETGAGVKMSGVSDDGDGDGVNVVNVNVSGKNMNVVMLIVKLLVLKVLIVKLMVFIMKLVM